MSRSLWLDTVQLPSFPPLQNDLEVDVCVVGGGIAGLTTAYLLKNAGLKVCVIEALELCGGQTGHTTAHFASALDDRFYEIEKDHGQKGARLAFESHDAAISKVLSIIQKEKIDCDHTLLDGYLFAKDDKKTNVLERELRAAKRAGAEVEIIARAPLTTFDTGPCLKFGRQLQLHPLKYLKGVVSALARERVSIFCHSRATHFKTVKDRQIVKTADGFEVSANAVVIATNSPVNDIVTLHTKQAPYRSYVVGFAIAKGSVPIALYWDTLDPYHYIRVQNLSETEDMLIVGGEDHKTGQDEQPTERYKELESWTRARFKTIGDVLYRWSGQVMEPVDGMAYLGRNPGSKNTFVITGDSGHGMTHATIGAMLVTDQILERKNPWEALYDPSRISLKSAGTFLQENVNVALQYGDWLTIPSDVDPDDIEAGEGLVYRDGLTPIAAYKTRGGEIRKMSAVCPHLAGIVSWNSAEKSFDCPCHGSRFDRNGRVIEGPATTDLAPIGEKERLAQKNAEPERTRNESSHRP